MDASKLLNILYELTVEHETDINVHLTALQTNLNSGSEEVSKIMNTLQELYDESYVNEYSPSNLKIIEKIGGTPYFGKIGYAHLTDLLSRNPYNVQRTTEELQNYTSQRLKFINLIEGCGNSLGKLNVDPHYNINDTFEVGLLFPKKFTDNKIVNITKELNTWDKVFKSIKELNGDQVDDTEINFINNGSLEFFINNSPAIAMVLAYSIKHIVILYKNIVEIRIMKDKLKDLGIAQADHKNIEKQEKEYLKNGLDEIASKLIQEFASKQIEEGRINELKIAFKGHVTYIAKCIDKGMIIEITPPEISAPKPAPENSSEDDKVKAKALNDKYKATLEKINIVQKSMDVVKELGLMEHDIMKYLTEGDSINEESNS